MNRFVITSIFLLLWVGAELGLWQLLRSRFKPGSLKRRIFTLIWFLFPLLNLLVFIVRPDGAVFVYRFLAQMVMIVTITKVLTFIVLLLAMLFSRIFSLFRNKPVTPDSRRNFFRKLVLFSSAVPMFAFLNGLFRTASNFRIHRVAIRSSRLPAAFHGFRIVQISDLHTGSVFFQKTMEAAVAIIESLKPDLVVFTGDLVNIQTEEALPYVDIFSRLRAPFGVYSVLGNHDYGDYRRWPDENAKKENFRKMLDVHKANGWRLLLNEFVEIEKNGEKFVLAGVENWGAKLNFQRYGDLNKCLEGVSPKHFVILLSHDPSHWQAEVVKHPVTVDLTLSGHTHGFQFGVEIPGFRWSPSQYVYEQWAGLYADGEKRLYVNRGTGCIGYAGRIGIPPEITLIELQTG